MNDFARSKALNNIPKDKLENTLEKINAGGGDLRRKNTRTDCAMRFAKSNIPLAYWDLKMDKDFFGDVNLKTEFENYAANLKKTFVAGTSLCLGGQHGVGKTMFGSCVLKAASLKGFSALYTTLSDVVAVLTQAPNEDKFEARRELMLVDFLVLDEVDPRFVGSDNASDLFGRNLENIFRTRSQNKLPTIICTNSPNIVESFSGTLKQSLGSLFAGGMKTVIVMGQDFRKTDVGAEIRKILNGPLKLGDLGMGLDMINEKLVNKNFEGLRDFLISLIESRKNRKPNLYIEEIEQMRRLCCLEIQK